MYEESFDKSGRIIQIDHPYYTLSFEYYLNTNNVSKSVKKQGTLEETYEYDTNGRIVSFQKKSNDYNYLTTYAYKNSLEYITDAVIIKKKDLLENVVIEEVHKDSNDKCTLMKSFRFGSVITLCCYDDRSRLIYYSSNGKQYNRECCEVISYCKKTGAKKIVKYSSPVEDENHLKRVEIYDSFGRELQTISYRKDGVYERYLRHNGPFLSSYQEKKNGVVKKEFNIQYLTDNGERETFMIKYSDGRQIVSVVDSHLYKKDTAKDIRLVKKHMKPSKFYR